MNEKYVLCFKGKDKDGRIQIYPIYKASLKMIDMYTCYKLCYSASDLLKCFPDYVSGFIKGKLSNEIDSSDLNKYFFIRKDCKDIRKGRTDLNILYRSDADIVYAKQEDIYSALYSLKLSIDNYKEDDFEIKLRKTFFSELCNILFEKETELANKIDKNNEKNFNLCEIRRFEGVAILPSNLKEISNFVSKDYILQRKVLIILKKYKKTLDDYKHVHTRLVSSENLKQRIDNRYFSVKIANENIRKCYEEELEFYYKKYPEEIPKEEQKDGNINKEAKEKNQKRKKTLEDNPDYIKYLRRIEDDEEEKENIEFVDEEEYDDFLGPKEPNDPRYWSI